MVGWTKHWHTNHKDLHSFYRSAIHLYLSFLAAREKRDVVHYRVLAAREEERSQFLARSKGLLERTSSCGTSDRGSEGRMRSPVSSNDLPPAYAVIDFYQWKVTTQQRLFFELSKASFGSGREGILPKQGHCEDGRETSFHQITINGGVSCKLSGKLGHV